MMEKYIISKFKDNFNLEKKIICFVNMKTNPRMVVTTYILPYFCPLTYLVT